MDTRPEGTIHLREREVVMWTYLLAIIPIFGILAAGIIYLTYQERSRTVVFHAKQAIAGQAGLLLVIIVIYLFYLFARLVGNVSPRLGIWFLTFDEWVLWLTFIAYACVCVYYAWRSLNGHDLEFPYIGARLRDRAE